MSRTSGRTHIDFRPRKSVPVTGTSTVTRASLDHSSALALAYIQAGLSAAGSPTVSASGVIRMALQYLAASLAERDRTSLPGDARRVCAARQRDYVSESEAWTRLRNHDPAMPFPTWSYISHGPGAAERLARINATAEKLAKQLACEKAQWLTKGRAT